MATKRKKRAPLNPERVLGTALKLADTKGLDALSMRSLAQALGVEAMSLYNHVPGKEPLLDGLVELVVGELEFPAVGGDWRAAMRGRAMTAHRVLLRHPWATMLLVSRLNVGPNMLRYVDRTLGCLREAGFSWAMADHAWNTLDAFTYGFTLQRLNFPLEASQYASAAKQFLPMIPQAQFPYLNGLSQEVIAGRHDGLQPIELGLDVLLEGLEALRVKAVLRPGPVSRSSPCP
jgi:AcrR family transcriptional regulator